MCDENRLIPRKVTRQRRALWAAELIAGVIFCGLLVYADARADTLAIVHTGCVSGDTVGKCTGGSYKARPAPGDLVRLCGSVANCWSAGEPLVRPLGGLPGATLIDSCTTPGVLEGATIPYPWVASADQCKNWQPSVASLFVAPPINTTGKITLDWDPVLLCHDRTDNIDKACNDPAHPTWAIRGYRVFSSGVSATALTLMQTVGPDVHTLVLPGYGNGTYYFAVAAFNTDAQTPDGDMSGVASVEVKKPTVPEASAQPKSVSGVRITVTYE